MKRTLPPLLAACLLLPLAEAGAQAVVACRDRNMNIVTCESGGGGGGGGGSGYMPGASELGAGAYGLGFAIGSFLRSLMVDDTDYAALARQEAEQQRQREEQIQRQRAAMQENAARRRDDDSRRQQNFQSSQRELIGMIKPLGGGGGSTITPLGPLVGSPDLGVRQLDLSAPSSPPAALPQLQAIEANRPDLQKSDEAAHQAASRGFDSGQPGGPASGPLMQVRGVPLPSQLPPAPPPVVAAPDPALQPMSLEQRRLIAEGKRAQSQLEALRQRRTRGEIDSDTLEREEASIKALINRLAQQFAAAGPASTATPAPPDTVAASSPPPRVLSAAPPPAPPPGLNVIAPHTGAPVGSCYQADPETVGCLEIRNTGELRIRIYFQEVPGVFCTVEPGSMCSRPVLKGVYNGFAERDDGRRTSLATLLLTPAGARWAVQF